MLLADSIIGLKPSTDFRTDATFEKLIDYCESSFPDEKKKHRLDLKAHATLQKKKTEVWFKAISGSAVVYFTDGLGSGLYPNARFAAPRPLFRR